MQMTAAVAEQDASEAIQYADLACEVTPAGQRVSLVFPFIPLSLNGQRALPDSILLLFRPAHAMYHICLLLRQSLYEGTDNWSG